ncbi:MAG: squalene synthase HpnC [Planctomycetes bacterium]|nr:squalene synthase HpnC [Planctomycetota bacterium]
MCRRYGTRLHDAAEEDLILPAGSDRYNLYMSYSFTAHLARFGPGCDYPLMDLAQARSYCARLTRSHYENFSVASILLPRQLVRHFHPVYAYCRWADDLGDETGGGQRALDLLGWWREELLDCYVGRARHPVMIALKPTIERFHIPPEPFLDLLSAFEQDQRTKSYNTFAELLDYCRRSANPVGRLVLYLCECFDEKRAELSDRICTGLQLANFWQDVARDFTDLGRVYLPEEDRQRFGYTDDELHAKRCTPAFRALMKFEVERTRAIFEQGRPLLGMLPRAVRADIELFLQGGLAILRKIEGLDYDVWSRRPKVGKAEKAKLLVGALIGGNARPTCMHHHVDERRHSVANSYVWCHRLTRRTAKNFFLAFQVLPRAQRKAMDALYAFMRITDDLADEAGEVESKRATLRDWRTALNRCLAGDYSHPLHPALNDTIQRYRIPPEYLHAVIDGVEMDLDPLRFATFAELSIYCYRVASAVGLCCIHIWGHRDPRAREYAEAAGIAFQLTNILRDLGEDLAQGRVYLPQEDIERFACPPETWRQQGPAFKAMMHYQVERARAYYQKAEILPRYLTPSGRAVFQVMLSIYRGLLDEIERRDYDVFRERVRLSPLRKIRHLLLAFPRRWGWL